MMDAISAYFLGRAHVFTLRMCIGTCTVLFDIHKCTCVMRNSFCMYTCIDFVGACTRSLSAGWDILTRQ